jgi:hypothetical protein
VELKWSTGRTADAKDEDDDGKDGKKHKSDDDKT